MRPDSIMIPTEAMTLATERNDCTGEKSIKRHDAPVSNALHRSARNENTLGTPRAHVTLGNRDSYDESPGLEGPMTRSSKDRSRG